SSLLHLSRFLEPLLVFGRLLPSFVGRTGANQVHVGAEVLLVLPVLVTGAVRPEAEVVGGELRRIRLGFRSKVTSLKVDAAYRRPRVFQSPETIPVRQARVARRVIDVFAPDHDQLL